MGNRYYRKLEVYSMDWAYRPDGMDLARYIIGTSPFASPIGLFCVLCVAVCFCRFVSLNATFRSGYARPPPCHGRHGVGAEQAHH